jgi:branched-chain amino acid transport system permease protein
VALYDRMGLYALVTIGLTLLMGYAGQISLGQGAFLIGAYTSAILTVGIDPDTRLVDAGAGVSPVLAVLAAPVVAAVLAAVIGVPLLRLHGHYLAFATLALHLIAFSVLSAWDRFTGGQYGISVTKPHRVRSRPPWPAACSRRVGRGRGRAAPRDQSRPLAGRARVAGDRHR